MSALDPAPLSLPRSSPRSFVAADSANIPSNYARLVGRELGLQVRDLPKLLKFTALSVDDFLRDDTLLQAQQLIQILQNGLLLAQRDTFSLDLGRKLTPATHGAMGFLVNSSPNLATALNAFQAFVPTRISFARLCLQHQPTCIECVIEFDWLLSADVHRALCETCAVIFFECAEFMIGRPLHDAKISFSHEKPSYSAVYANYFSGSRYAFAQPQFKMSVPLDACYVANASANHEGYMLAMQQCETMLTQLKSQQHSSTVYQVQKIMLAHRLNALSEQNVAEALFISARTLARRLDKEGSSYRQIRDKILSQQACNYLRDSSMSVEAIASLLNYHDSANFRRAFKRWFGLSPRDYRLQSATIACRSSGH